MNATSLQHATESARAALASLSNDVLAIADVLATAFGLPYPETPDATPATFPGAAERVCQSLDAVTRTCSSASGQLRAATRRTANPVAGNYLERVDGASLQGDVAAARSNLNLGTTFANGVVVALGPEAAFHPQEEIARREADLAREVDETIDGDPFAAVAEQITGDPDDWPTPEEGDKVIAEGDQDEAEIEALEDAASQGGDPELDIGEQRTEDGRKANRKARRRKAATGRKKK